MATNKNKQPPAPPAKRNAAEDLDEDIDLDDEEDEDNEIEDDLDAADEEDVDASSGNGTSGRNWMKTQRLPPAKREAVLIGNLVGKVERRLDTIKNWPTDECGLVRAELQAAIEKLKGGAELLATLPDTFRPRSAGGGGKSSRELTSGSFIRITDRQMANYEGIVEPEQMRGIKVVEVRGNKVVATLPATKDSPQMRAVFPRGHVTLDESQA